MSIKLCDGKYEFYIDDVTGRFMCKRYDSSWRDFVGDKAVHALYEHALELQARVAELEDERLRRKPELVREALWGAMP